MDTMFLAAFCSRPPLRSAPLAARPLRRFYSLFRALRTSCVRCLLSASGFFERRQNKQYKHRSVFAESDRSIIGTGAFISNYSERNRMFRRERKFPVLFRLAFFISLSLPSSARSVITTLEMICLYFRTIRGEHARTYYIGANKCREMRAERGESFLKELIRAAAAILIIPLSPSHSSGSSRCPRARAGERAKLVTKCHRSTLIVIIRREADVKVLKSTNSLKFFRFFVLQFSRARSSAAFYHNKRWHDKVLRPAVRSNSAAGRGDWRDAWARDSEWHQTSLSRFGVLFACDNFLFLSNNEFCAGFFAHPLGPPGEPPSRWSLLLLLRVMLMNFLNFVHFPEAMSSKLCSSVVSLRFTAWLRLHYSLPQTLLRRLGGWQRLFIRCLAADSLCITFFNAKANN